MYFNLGGIIFYTDAVDLVEDVVAASLLSIGAEAAWKVLAARAGSVAAAIGRIPQLAAASRAMDGARFESAFATAVFIATIGII